MAVKFYGSVNDESNLIVDLYGGRDKKARRITKLYGAVLGTIYTAVPNSNDISVDVDKLFKANSETQHSNLTPLQVSIAHSTSSYLLEISYKNSSETQIFYRTNTNLFIEILLEWGVGASYNLLYGSTNVSAYADIVQSEGYVSKLIHQGFGHLNYT